MSENNIVINNSNTINMPQQSRGAGTVLMIVFLWWLLIWWWQLLLVIWIVWLPIAAIISIWDEGFFTNNWYQPWPAWMFGIR